ncbi:MAG: methylmalonyl Co-A mutase-associated GTPase MeaB [Gemmatimonadaceae bacterium]
MTAASLASLLAGFDARKPAALARAVSVVENHQPGYDSLLATLHPRVGRARRIGITGPPGAGKSTLVARIVHGYRASGLTVAVIAVDPTSPFTGGSLLGDRIRMEAVALDPGVFIRSMATRGSLGGLAAAAREVCDVVDAFGFDRVLLETVGVGQSELEVARTADSTLVVLVPESGDSIQTLKAGLMEIADIFAINKADRPGADRLRTDVTLMLGLRVDGSPLGAAGHHGVDLRPKLARHVSPATGDSDVAAWTPPVLRTVAAQAEGTEDVLDALDQHFRYLERTGDLRSRRRRRLRERVIEVAEDTARRRLWTDPGVTRWLEGQLPALEAGTITPFAVADELLARTAHLLTGAR